MCGNCCLIFFTSVPETVKPPFNVCNPEKVFVAFVAYVELAFVVVKFKKEKCHEIVFSIYSFYKL